MLVEIIMFKGDAIVEGSRQMTSDPLKIRQLEQYAKENGYTFSCNSVKEYN